MMNKFIKRLLLFSAILFCYLGINYIVNTLIFSQTAIPIKDSRILILGDSHTRRAIKPQLFESAVNISQQSEPYIISYWKLKHIVKYKKIDTILLSFSAHNISAFNDRKFEDEKWSSEMFERTYLINDFDDVGDMVIDTEEFYKTYFFKMLLYPNLNHFTFIGEYTNSNKSDYTDSEKVIGRHFYKDSLQLDVSKTAILFLNKIITLCKEHDIVPILISTPVHKDYFSKIPSNILEEYTKLEKGFLQQNIKVVNYSEHYYSNEFYYNSDHLNHKGATKFTNNLITLFKTTNFEN